MKVFNLFYSIFFLGLLLILHILKRPFRRSLRSSEYIERFRGDGIRAITSEDIDALLDASRCVCCDICSFVGKDGRYYNVAEDVYRRSRDLTSVYDKTENLYYDSAKSDCPYGIDVKRVNMLLSRD